MIKLSEGFRLLNKLAILNWRTLQAYYERRSYRCNILNYEPQFPEAVFQRHEPVFVLSTGRCGTALLTQLLARSPKALCYHSPSPELTGIERQVHREGHVNFDCYLTAIAVARFELIADSALRGRRYVETNRHITFFAPHLRHLFPRARFIHLVRHPGAFVRSGIRRRYYQGSYGDMGRIQPYQGEAESAWPEMNAYERCAWLWNETNAFIERIKSEAKCGSILTVKSENLFTDPETTIKIFEHCGFDCPELGRVASWIKRKVNVQLEDTTVAPHGQWDDKLKESVRRWAPLAANYGYEL